ncbi:MAG: hypothetical protein WC003_16035 [Terrimicrobiaceae bacterium]
MKRSIALLLIAFAAATANAGSIGGPPPFTNGSPLTTGIDGSYQASARGKNLSGVIRFAISGGVQTFGTASLSNDTVQRGNNSWAIFYQGRLYKGLTEAGISDSSITGVLSASDITPTAINNLQTSSGIQITTDTAFPQEALIQGQNLSGYFTATMSQKSPTGSFKGNGKVEVTLPAFYTYSEQTPTLPGVANPGDNMSQNPSSAQAQSVTDSSSQGVPDPSNPTASGYGHLTSASFKIRGTRNSTTVASTEN